MEKKEEEKKNLTQKKFLVDDVEICKMSPGM